MAHPGREVFAVVAFSGRDVWRRALILEADGDRWTFAVESPTSGRGHFQAGGKWLVLVTGAAGQLRANPPGDVDPSSLGELPSFRTVMKAYFAYEENDPEDEYLSASDGPDVATAAARPLEEMQGEDREKAAELERVLTAAASSRDARRTWQGPAGLVGEGGDGDFEGEGALDPLGRLARQAQSLWRGVLPGAASASAAAPTARGLGSLQPQPPRPPPSSATSWHQDPLRAASPGAPWSYPPGIRAAVNAPGPGGGMGSLGAPWAAAAAPAYVNPGRGTPSGSAFDLNTLVKLEILRTLQRRQEDDWTGTVSATGEMGARGVEKSLRSLHAMKKLPQTQPRQIVEEYIERTKESLGVQPGQVWSLLDRNKRIARGRHKGLHRIHHMLSELFSVMDQDRLEEAQALTVQCFKGVHQTMLDDGDWRMGWHLTTLRDPLAKVRFGGAERELEAVAAYTRALDELDTRLRKEKAREHEHDGDDTAAETRPKGKGKAKAGAASGA